MMRTYSHEEALILWEFLRKHPRARKLPGLLLLMQHVELLVIHPNRCRPTDPRPSHAGGVDDLETS